jgi:hypothetical protein
VYLGNGSSYEVFIALRVKNECLHSTVGFLVDLVIFVRPQYLCYYLYSKL